MCKEKATTILQETSSGLTGWNKAIYDAEQKIAATKSRLSKLKAARALFIEKRDGGEPFPGEKSEQTEAGA